MKLTKNSLKADKIANLYRAAFSLAKGDQITALNFLNQSSNFKLAKKLAEKLEKQEQLLLAEKILDEYHQEVFSKGCPSERLP